MSVIVYRDGVLAGDRRSSVEGVRLAPLRKIGQAGGRLFGVAGNVVALTAVFTWGKTARGKCKIPEGAQAEVILFKDNVLFRGESHGDEIMFAPYDAEFLAIGSGWQLAMGALSAGATAEEAVRITCEHDLHCGDGIDVERLVS